MQKVILPAIRRSRGLFTDYQQVRQDRASSCQTRPEPECLSAVRLYRYGHTQKGRSNELFAERVSFKIICWRKPPPVRALIANRIKTGVPAVRKDPVSADTSATRVKTGPSTNCREPTHAVNIKNQRPEESPAERFVCSISQGRQSNSVGCNSPIISTGLQAPLPEPSSSITNLLS